METENLERGTQMARDILLQIGFILITVLMYLWTLQIPQKAYSKLRTYQTRSTVEAKRHFVRGAQLLSQAQALAAKDPLAAASLAKSAAKEADGAISFDPKDAAAHILKALALDLQGFRTSALDSFNAALSPMAAKSLMAEERGDALLRRAELKVALSSIQAEQGDSAIVDLVESVRLKSDNPRAYSVLGGCYEKKGLIEEAKKAYEEAVRLDPTSVLAREDLDRLTS